MDQPHPAPPTEPPPVFYICACGYALGRVTLGALEFIAEDGGLASLKAGERTCPVCGRVKLWQCREQRQEHIERRARGRR